MDRKVERHKRRRRTDPREAGSIEKIRHLLGDPARQLQLSLLLLAGLTAGGTLGYQLLTNGSLVDSLYMTVNTLTTTGFRESVPLDTAGQLFTIVLLIVGVGVAAWAITNAIEVMLGQTFWVSVQRRRMRELLMDLREHYIVCGYGRLGRQIVRDLQARGERYLVIERSPEQEESLLELHIPHVIGDATHDDILERAGVARAKGLVSALDEDGANVLTVLSARELNPDLLIVARANSETIEAKLRRAGADRMVTPEAIGGHRLALALLRPAVHDLFSSIFNPGEAPDIDVGQLTIAQNSAFDGRTLADCDLGAEDNLTVLAIRSHGGEFSLTPSRDRRIAAGDVMIVIGPASAVYKLEALHTE
ncbi:MAG: NAD-binding protein [Longimicrobiales bacterium]